MTSLTKELSDDPAFMKIFDEMDTDGNGTLDQAECFALLMKYDKIRSQNSDLKKWLTALAVSSIAVIVLLSAAMFGVTYAAMEATKEITVNDMGVLQSAHAGHQDQAIVTVATGSHFKFVNSSDANTPLCLLPGEIGNLFEDVLEGKKVVMDVETEGTGEHGISELKPDGAYLSPNETCFKKLDDSFLCFIKATDDDGCYEETERRRLNGRQLTSCGGHSASSCAYCGPDGTEITSARHGGWCNGECEMNRMETACESLPPVTVRSSGPVSCGGHYARSCAYCGPDGSRITSARHGGWCNGECEMNRMETACVSA